MRFLTRSELIPSDNLMSLNVSDAPGPSEPSGIPVGLVRSKNSILRQRSPVNLERVSAVILDGLLSELASEKLDYCPDETEHHYFTKLSRP